MRGPNEYSFHFDNSLVSLANKHISVKYRLCFETSKFPMLFKQRFAKALFVGGGGRRPFHLSLLLKKSLLSLFSNHGYFSPCGHTTYDLLGICTINHCALASTFIACFC